MIETPLEEIKYKLAKKIPKNLLKLLPNNWEKIGEVLIIVLSPKLKSYKELISQKYAEVLKCKTVLNDIGGIYGEFRQPDVELLYGSDNTITIHKENGIKYRLDPQKIMFSSGNMNERIRMAKISNGSETIVDLFAGVGYFSLPIAVYSKPKRIIACEKNKISYKFLCENIFLNGVTDIIEPIEGDNRLIAPKNCANRIVMGYIGNTINFFSTALKCLNEGVGIVHFHDKYPEEIVPNKPLKNLQSIANEFNRIIKLISYNKVKTYAPKIGHYVFDLKIEEK